MSRLAGRTALVTGAARGIGKSIALRLAADGAAIVIADVLETGPAVTEIKQAGGRAIGVRADVSSEADVAAVVKKSEHELGHVDILVNNAAMTTPPRPFEQISKEEWCRMLEVNALGPFLLSKAVVPGMRERKHGRIINIASDTFHGGVPFMIHYVSSKGALIAFTRALAREVGKDGITVNAIAPGFTLSERIAAQKDRVEAFREHVTMKQLAIPRDELPEDLVGAASFLAGDDSSFMTGQTLVVDGGLAMV
jgi:NAD(P)-dependent dehydrogenase (short-subunit alcohol dehydrogenase family)